MIKDSIRSIGSFKGCFPPILGVYCTNLLEDLNLTFDSSMIWQEDDNAAMVILTERVNMFPVKNTCCSEENDVVLCVRMYSD